MTGAVNSRLAEALSNQKAIEHDTRQIQLQSAQLTKYSTHTHHTARAYVHTEHTARD